MCKLRCRWRLGQCSSSGVPCVCVCVENSPLLRCRLRSGPLSHVSTSMEGRKTLEVSRTPTERTLQKSPPSVDVTHAACPHVCFCAGARFQKPSRVLNTVHVYTFEVLAPVRAFHAWTVNSNPRKPRKAHPARTTSCDSIAAPSTRLCCSASPPHGSSKSCHPLSVTLGLLTSTCVGTWCGITFDLSGNNMV